MKRVTKRVFTAVMACMMACLMFVTPVLAATNNFSKTMIAVMMALIMEKKIKNA